MSKKGNEAAKRRRKKAEKAKKKSKLRLAKYRAQQAVAGARRAKLGEAARLLKDGQSVPDITDEEYVFWLCHGANFIASDEESGLWEPLFEGIYEGTIPKAESVAQAVMNRYSAEIEAEDTLRGVPRSVLAWTVSEKSAVRIFKYEAERRLQEKDAECDAETLAKQPHNPVVWGIFSEVKKRTLVAPLAE